MILGYNDSTDCLTPNGENHVPFHIDFREGGIPGFWFYVGGESRIIGPTECYIQGSKHIGRPKEE